MESRQKLTNPDYISGKVADDVTERMTKLSTGEYRGSPAGIVDYEGAHPKHADYSMQRTETPKYSDTQGMQSTKTGLQGKDMLETTYGASYEIGRSDLRSGDLARTLGKTRAAASDRHREVLVD